MKQIEYNLLEERWMRVRGQDYTVQEVSLPDALLHAHEYRDLAGELPTQDAAMLRLLLAVLHTVFSRVDGNGTPAPFEETDDALIRWEELYRLGHFPEAPIRAYLEQWRDRFWLFHPERPFWQVPEAKIGSPFRAKKLNGEIFESENKDSLFSAYSGEAKERLTYPQAARWLVFLNNYDDTAAKKKAKDRTLPSMGPGWLGRLGVVYVKGANLFDTLMRNLMFLRDGGKLWEEDAPCWELDAARTEERTEVPCPDNFAGLMTMQYRRILLKRQEGWVTGCTVLGGDFFDSTNAFAEPMTLWNKKEESKNNPRYYYPRVHSMSKQLWREFSALTGIDSHVPGVIWWNTLLQNEKILSRKEHLQICALGVEYGKMSNSMTDCYTDQLSMELALLNELGRAWQSRVEDEVENCEQAAQCVGRLAWELSLAAGDKNDTTAESARTQFYFTIDQPFRLWLQSIDPETDKLDEKADDVYGGRLPVHVRCLIDECANIGQIPKLEKLVATIRSREISACLVLQAQSQLKAIYKDNADTIIGNMDTSIFLGGKEPTTLKELAAVLGKETIDTYNTGESRGRETSHSLNYQKLGKELMSQDELAVMDGGKCILQLRGVRPFLSDKYDITRHPNFKYTADADKRNTFDIEAFLSARLKLKPDEVCDVYEVDTEGV